MAIQLAKPPGMNKLGDANFSIFVVPFRYRLSPVHGEPTPAVFAPRDTHADPLFAQRFHYFTGETREIVFGEGRDDNRLFGRLEREVFEYELSKDLSLRWHPGQDDEPWSLDASVRLILFERHRAQKMLPSYESCGCIGFLAVEVPFPDDTTPSQLLDFNTNFRLLRYQYPGQRCDLEKRWGAMQVPAGWKRCGAFEMRNPAAPAEPAVVDAQDTILFWKELLALHVEDHDDENAGPQYYAITPDLSAHPDDRSFVVSHACVASDTLVMNGATDVWTFWHQLLYVDPGLQPMRGHLIDYEEDWIRQRTYMRWNDDGRLYGYSGFSFCSLCTDRAWSVPIAHFKSIYFDMLILMLYQRAAVFAYSRELSSLSQKWKDVSWESARMALSRLRAAFGQFVNLYWFPVFTYQLQGLEMYEIARRELGNEELFDELRTEMEGTWTYLEAKYAEQLNRLGSLIVVVGLLTAYLGMNIITPAADGSRARLLWPSLAVWLWGLCLAGFCFLFYRELRADRLPQRIDTVQRYVRRHYENTRAVTSRYWARLAPHRKRACDLGQKLLQQLRSRMR